MSTNDPFERMVAGYLADGAPDSVSDRELDGVLSTTSRMRPYPRWLALLKEPPMRISSRVTVGSPTFRLATILAVTLALAIAASGAVIAGTSLATSTGVVVLVS